MARLGSTLGIVLIDLKPREPLTQVVFVHDYFQLVFDTQVLGIYNPATVSVDGRAIEFGRPGFADALVKLLGSRVVQAKTDSESGLLLTFESNATLEILGSPSEGGILEAYSFTESNGPIVVAHNA